ncbi:MAG: peroxide stress protein YaaA [Bacillota bacterium]|nr:peroxide stress protein YaaA [Bacillota bacterium]
MRIIISPAKKMRVETDSLPWRELPCFLERTEYICSQLKALSAAELKALWKCNDKILELNLQRLVDMDLRKNLSPAILAYEGIQYQYMAPSVFSQQEFDYIQEHLRILSGFYGILRPFDGVQPYRLEMQAKLSLEGRRDLYAYWDKLLAEQVYSETDCVLNLASKEYSRCISAYRKPGDRFINCSFGEEKDGKILEKGTLCKMARGEMVRFLAERQIKRVEEIQAFSGLNYRFSETLSNAENYIFLAK